MAGVRLTGMVAAMALDGPISGRSFRAYIDQVLVPALKPGDVVVMDNPGSHKGPGVRAAIEAAGARLLYVPPSSPDFNPIESAFSKLKALLRRAAERLVAGLWPASPVSQPSSSPTNAPTSPKQPGMIQIKTYPL